MVRCVNQLASVYWPSKMFVTTVFIMVLVGPGPPVFLISSATGMAGIFIQREKQRANLLKANCRRDVVRLVL